METKISIFIISYNEENIISKCLEKLYWADEIIVIDSGSTDKTVSICESYGAKVIYQKFENFGKQKQYALSQTNNDWVLNLDADEVLSDNLIEEIKSLNFFSNGYKIKFNHVFMNKIFKYGNESNRLILRLFNKNFGKYNELDVHEFIEIKGKVSNLNHSLNHYSYTSINKYIEKLNFYTSLYAMNKYNKNIRFNLFTIIIKTVFEFFKKYIFDKNILNGKEGFYWSVFSSFYTFTKCLKTNEKSNYNNSL
jgi:glycosyltransferase involved in cell wall biosynthesis